jgi:hypothetical protein
MTGSTQGGFVVRAVEGVRELFDREAETAADYAPVLTRRLFGDALGYDDTAYSQHDGWAEVRFVDENGRQAVVLTASDAGEDIRQARRRAFRAAAEQPTLRYLIATNRNRLVCFVRCADDHPEGTTRDGVTARPLTEIDLRAAVERSAGNSLAATLTPGQQLSLAKLTTLRREAVSAALEEEPLGAGDVTLGDLTGSTDASDSASPEALAETLTETLSDVLVPAVEDAFDRLTRRIQEYADQEAALEERIEAAKAAGDEAVTDRRADLFDLRERYAAARRLEAGFARWRRVTATPDERDDFCAESAAVVLDTLLLARVAADRGLAGRFDDYRAFWEEHAEHAERDARDLVRAVREELAGVSEDATDDGTYAWVFEAEIADAFAEAVSALSTVDTAGMDAQLLTDAFDGHLDAESRPVRGSTRPATAGLLLDRAGYTADAPIDRDDAGLLDPACGDGSTLVRAADRLVTRLDRSDAAPAETLATVRDSLHGLDIHPYAVHLAESRLLLRTIDVHADAVASDDEFTLGRFSVHRVDALAETTEGDGESRRAERQAAAEAVREREGFGYVVGDVPTGTPSVGGEADASTRFLTRAADWLAPQGRLSMAVAGDVLDAPGAADAREQLAERFRLRELVHFDTGGESAPLFVAAERRGEEDERDGPPGEQSGAADAGYEFTYARVTPTFLDLVRAGLVRPDGSANAGPAELVGRCLPDEAGGDPPVMETVLVELDLVCDATVDGPDPVTVTPVASDALAEDEWRFAAPESVDGDDESNPASENDPDLSPLDGTDVTDSGVTNPWSSTEE